MNTGGIFCRISFREWSVSIHTYRAGNNRRMRQTERDVHSLSLARHWFLRVGKVFLYTVLTISHAHEWDQTSVAEITVHASEDMHAVFHLNLVIVYFFCHLKRSSNQCINKFRRFCRDPCLLFLILWIIFLPHFPSKKPLEGSSRDSIDPPPPLGA